MAKELPYFKFEPAEWLTGRISLEPFEVQGAFINICCLYWQRLGDVKIKEAQLRLRSNYVVLLQSEFIEEDEGCIRIKFLDAQLDERESISEKRANAGRKGGKANAKQTEAIAKQKRIEENREEKKRVKENREFSSAILDCFQKCLQHFPEELHPKSESDKFNWLDTIEKLERIDNIPLEAIEIITEAARSDDFWSTNFLSLTKLRKKDKHGVMYIAVFYHKFIKNGNNQKRNRKGGITDAELKSILRKHFDQTEGSF